MTKEEIVDGLEIYTVGRLNKDRVQITVGELQKFIDAIKALKQEPTIQEKQAESEKYQKAFDDGYDNGYAQARFDYEQESKERDTSFINKPCISIGVCHEDKIKVLDKIIGYIDHIRNTGMGKKKSLEFIEKFIERYKTEK